MMERTRLYILSLLLLLMAIPKTAFAQLDPTLTAMVLAYTSKAKSQYKSQSASMAAETAGHIWLKQEVDETTNYQRQFDKYISEFRGIIAYAAQTYGFYHEVSHLTDNMGKLSHQIGETPTNAIAVALHQKRNDIYVSIINKSVGIVNTIRQVCIDNKMTEKQRIELIFSIRPQLHEMNKQLAMLTKLVKHTTLAQVWYNIERRSLPHREGKAGIIEDCLAMWRLSGKSVKPNN